MAKVLFLVHGIGKHGPGWSAGVRRKLNALSERYAAFQTGLPFDQRVEISEIAYDGVFRDQVAQFGGDFAQLTAFAQASGASLGSLPAWFPTASLDEQNFFWDAVVDVLLYFAFRLVRERVRVVVMQQVAAKLKAGMAGGQIVNPFVLAHSLGTAVASDSLALLGSRPFDGSNAFMAGQGVKFKGIYTLANVSREVRTDIDSYASVLHPDSAQVVPPSTAYCARYRNFRHKLDPVCLLEPFAPVGWGGDFTSVDDLDHFHGFNVHDFEHYLDHPKVHIPIINGVFEQPIITPAERAQAISTFPVLAAQCSVQLTTLRNTLAALARPTSVHDLVRNGARALAEGKRLATECAGVV